MHTGPGKCSRTMITMTPTISPVNRFWHESSKFVNTNNPLTYISHGLHPLCLIPRADALGGKRNRLHQPSGLWGMSAGKHSPPTARRAQFSPTPFSFKLPGAGCGSMARRRRSSGNSYFATRLGRPALRGKIRDPFLTRTRIGIRHALFFRSAVSGSHR